MKIGSKWKGLGKKSCNAIYKNNKENREKLEQQKSAKGKNTQ